MAAITRQLKLGAFFNPTGHHVASWRHPDADADAGVNLEHYVALAQMAERAKFDMVFLADTVGVRNAKMEALSRSAQYIANFEPTTLVSALAMVTNCVGLVCTMSTSYNEPYHVARRIASIDHISNGRAGWNLVTSSQDSEALNFGLEAHYGHSERYLRANEFAEIVTGLWDSWDDDAFVRDKASGLFFEPQKMRVLNHHGPHFKVKGPLNIPRPPQGQPVIVQAGTSDDGIEVAARFAEVIFSSHTELPDCLAYGRALRTRAQDKFGRNPSHIKIMPGLSIYVGATRRKRMKNLSSRMN
jgi:FMN-dependent oxidoreductase (nitrilotriacetate monooxygenase family)